jgi:hypothetical protein
MRALALVVVACSSSATPSDPVPAPPPPPAIADASPPEPAPTPWLRGSTHVHAKPSGDSATAIPEVIRWYETHGYDFIVLTDHNQVSEVDLDVDTAGKPYVHSPASGLIVISGIELTENATDCVPAGDDSGKCRIHINVLGTPARPRAKLKDWMATGTKDRVAKYTAALAQAAKLGGVVQLNHPQWFWGMTPDVLVATAKRGAVLYELWNRAFAKWNPGDATHPSTEALWDAALQRGVTLWAVASDDAHHYDGGGKYPAGGAWVMVKARRDPQAILDALGNGAFYASTGVTLDRAEVDRGELVVTIASSDPATAVTFVENGKRIDVAGKTARRALPASGYIRAVIERQDGARAWTQPARR